MPPPSEFGERFKFLHLDRMTGAKARRHCRAARHRDADHARLAPLALDRGRHARRKPAARKRHQHAFEIRKVRNDFQSERALAGNDGRVVEGRDFGQPFLAHQSVDLRLRVVLRAPDDADVGAEFADRVDLVLRHERGEAHDGAHAFGPRGERDRASVIAG